MFHDKFSTSRQLPLIDALFEQANETDDVKFLLEMTGLFKPYSIRAHKCVLMAGSSVFKAMFTDRMTKRDEINIVGITWYIFYDFLALFYAKR